MTYPPQQPPGPYGPQQPYGQQPQGPYGPTTPWSGQQPGFPVGPPPPKRRAGLIASLIIVAILVVGGGGVGLYFLLSNDKEDSSAGPGGGEEKDDPRAAADAYVKALGTAINTKDINDVDLKPLKPLACKDDFDALEEELEDAQEYNKTSSPQPRPKIEISIDDFKETQKGATFTVVREADGDSNEREMDVLKESDSWRVCGLYRDEDDGGSGPSTSRPMPNPIPTT